MNRNIFEIIRLRKNVVKLSAIAFIGAVSMLGVSRVAHAVKPVVDDVPAAVQGEVTRYKSTREREDKVSSGGVVRELAGSDDEKKLEPNQKRRRDELSDDKGLTAEVDKEKVESKDSMKDKAQAGEGASSTEQVDDYNLGKNFYVLENYAVAKEHLERALAAGNERANFYLGWYYLKGILIDKDEKRAREYFSRVVPIINDPQDAESLFMRWAILKEKRLQDLGLLKVNVKEGIECLKMSAEQGYSLAQYSLGMCYLNGIGVAKDESEAVEWYKKAAIQGYANAQCNLGLCYLNGIGVAKDEIEAFEWSKKAAIQGSANAQCNLGLCYKNGIGVNKDFGKAVEWCKKAADQGYAIAQFNLGLWYTKGNVIKQDYVEAARLYELAAKQGFAAAQCNLGECYSMGRGVEQNFREAAKWYYEYQSKISKSKIKVQTECDPVERTKYVLDEFARRNYDVFFSTYFEDYIDPLTDFLEANGLGMLYDEALIKNGIFPGKEDPLTGHVCGEVALREKLDKKEIDVSVLNKLLFEAQDVLEYSQTINAISRLKSNEEALYKIGELVEEYWQNGNLIRFCLPEDGKGIVLTPEFLRPYVVSPWRSSKVTESKNFEIIANIYGSEIFEDLLYGARGNATGENVYDYIFGEKGKYKKRFYSLCRGDSGRSRELLAREMYWLRCMNEMYKAGKLNDESKRAFEECKRKVRLSFGSATGACHNELADIMILWAKAIDECEVAMGIGAKVRDQRDFDERLVTEYRMSLVEKILSLEYVSTVKAKDRTKGIEKLEYALKSNMGPEFKNYYRLLIGYLLRVRPAIGSNLALDQSMSRVEMITLVSKAIDLKYMCTIAQNMYQYLADEKDAVADDMSDGEEAIKVMLAKTLEAKYPVTFDEFCSVVDRTCDGKFRLRLNKFLKLCEKSKDDDMDEDELKEKDKVKSDIKAWIDGEKSFTVAELFAKICMLDDLGENANACVPELFRFNSVLGSRNEKAAEYYAKVLYPIHLVKSGLIKIS